MKKNWLLAGGLVLILALVGLVGCEGGAVSGDITELNLSSQQQGIWVTGEGKVSAVPDIATLSLGIEAQETSVALAQTQAAQAMDKVMTALTGNGIAKKDIQTQYFNISKVTRWDDKTQQEVVIGYRVTNTVTAKIRDIEKTGTIIDAVAQAGGDLTRVNSINFSIEDPTDYYNEVRGEAMADAKAKAEQLANLADVTLGKPTYISESFYTPPIITRGAFESAPAAPVETPISPGELEITLNLQVTYAIK